MKRLHKHLGLIAGVLSTVTIILFSAVCIKLFINLLYLIAYIMMSVTLGW